MPNPHVQAAAEGMPFVQAMRLIEDAIRDARMFAISMDATVETVIALAPPYREDCILLGGQECDIVTFLSLQTRMALERADKAIETLYQERSSGVVSDLVSVPLPDGHRQAIKAAQEDADPLLSLIVEYVAERARLDARFFPDDEAMAKARKPLEAMWRRLKFETPVPTTRAGAFAALRLVKEEMKIGPGSFEEPVIKVAIDFLELEAEAGR